MIDVQSIAAAFGSLKAASDITKGLISLKTTTEVQAVAIELNGKIIDAQQSIFAAQATQTALVDQVRELKGEIAEMKHWDAEKQRYKLMAPFAGCMVYALQKAMSDGETAHYLCTDCFQKGKKSILQGRHPVHPKPGQGRGHATYVCTTCKTEAPTPWNNIVAPQYFEDIVPST